MAMAFAVKDGIPSMRFETRDSASMLFRQVDIDLAVYPKLAWRWYIEFRSWRGSSRSAGPILLQI